MDDAVEADEIGIFFHEANKSLLFASHAWGTISTYTCKFGPAEMIFLKKILKVHSAYPLLVFGNGVEVSTTFPLKQSFLLGTSPKCTAEQHLHPTLASGASVHCGQV